MFVPQNSMFQICIIVKVAKFFFKNSKTVFKKSHDLPLKPLKAIGTLEHIRIPKWCSKYKFALNERFIAAREY